jgi:hypothetical protein
MWLIAAECATATGPKRMQTARAVLRGSPMAIAARMMVQLNRPDIRYRHNHPSEGAVAWVPGTRGRAKWTSRMNRRLYRRATAPGPRLTDANVGDGAKI